MPKKLWIIVILVNVLLTSIILLEPSRVINSDGVLYLQTAEAYWKGGWSAAIHFYPWPFYSILIAFVSHIIHCHLDQAAYLVNIFFQVLICMGFVYLVCETVAYVLPLRVNHTKCLRVAACPRHPDNYLDPAHKARDVGRERDVGRFILFATLIILCYPILNQQRDLIVRDFGYWAFSLWGWLYLIRLNKSQRFLDGFKFNFSMLFASLFRLEGIVMLLLGPFAVFANTQITMFERLKLFTKIYSVLLVGFLMGCIYFQIHTPTAEILGRLLDFKTQIYSGIGLMLQAITTAKTAIATQVLTPLSADGALTLLLGGLIAIYGKTLFFTMTPVYSVLVAVSFWKKSFLPAPFARPVIYTAIGLNVLITIIFLAQNLFLDRRYIFELCCLLLLWIPFILIWIYEQTDTQYRWLFPSVLGFLVLIGVVSLYNFGPSKYYLKEAGVWIHQEQQMNVKWIYTNSPQVYFYADSPQVTWKTGIAVNQLEKILKNLKMASYDYFVVQINTDDAVLKNQLTKLLGKPIKIFLNKKGDVVWVFDLKIHLSPWGEGGIK